MSEVIVVGVTADSEQWGLASVAVLAAQRESEEPVSRVYPKVYDVLDLYVLCLLVPVIGCVEAEVALHLAVVV